MSVKLLFLLPDIIIAIRQQGSTEGAGRSRTGGNGGKFGLIDSGQPAGPPGKWDRQTLKLAQTRDPLCFVRESMLHKIFLPLQYTGLLFQLLQEPDLKNRYKYLDAVSVNR